MSANGQHEELDSNQVLRMFRVTPMTLHNWRKGKNNRSPLPFHTKPRGTRQGVYFLKHEVVAWAVVNKIEILEDVPGTPRLRVLLNEEARTQASA